VELVGYRLPYHQVRIQAKVQCMAIACLKEKASIEEGRPRQASKSERNVCPNIYIERG
jgi:hypothetical protein